VAGWTKGDRSVIVYDANDLWEISADGSARPKRLTDGAAEDIRYRYVHLSPSAGAGGRGGRGGAAGNDAIDLEKPVYLSMEGRWTKKTGYSVLRKGTVERLIYEEKGVRGLEKAKDAEVLVYQSGAWDDSPNFFAGSDLKAARQISETNPFASQYAWGKAELVDYRNSHGDRLQGALYYPANYEKGKQYPMIVQIYEIESNQLHNWTAPSERSTYNAAVWTQHGYFVFRPDIVFKPREPGISALDCVTSGVKKVLAGGMIDAKHVGLTGHSWGGYETTFIVTHSDLFAAGAVGGALTNLSSSVGEIYWNTGAPETNHVEVSQERMQVPLYEDPESYIKNSSTFVANKLAAPLLMEVGDQPGHRVLQCRAPRRKALRDAGVRRRKPFRRPEGQPDRLSPPHQRLVRPLSERRSRRGLDDQRRVGIGARARVEIERQSGHHHAIHRHRTIAVCEKEGGR
jgi:dipeptidyl aminopeptidase/acylaminoacyl peptidase